MIEQAKIQGGRRVSGHTEKIRAGQAGRRIIEEATDMRAAAIVMPLPRRVAGASLFGKTLETVLDRAAVPGDHRVDPGRQRRRCSLCRASGPTPTASTAPEIVVSGRCGGSGAAGSGGR